jgi:predicted metalloprotease with PDZ domain
LAEVWLDCNKQEAVSRDFPEEAAMKTTFSIVLLAGLLCKCSPLSAQQPVLDYTLAVNPDNLATVQITMRLRNLPANFHLAMVRHFLNDDRSWRNIEDLQIEPGTIAMEQDGLWRVNGARNDATFRYKVRLEGGEASRVVSKPFLTPTGGLFGDMHMFMYVVEAAQAPAHVLLKLPPDWTIATELTPTRDPHIFYARNAQQLSDSPILAGKLREWSFQVDQTPIRVAYWPLPDAKPFDEKAMVDGMQRITQTAVNLFGGSPWREYLFQVRDGAYEEGMEHFDCVTLGLPSATLAKNPHADEDTIAHEFFHTWNMMRIHSVEYTGPDYRPVQLSGLWVSEGFTMFYADLLVRRAGLPPEQPTRSAHLEQLISDYLDNPDNARFSAEQTGRVAFNLEKESHPDVWVQGELLGTMLDFSIRDATGGRRSLDDLMRAMYANSSGERGFTTNDVERLAQEVCGCSLKPFFDAYIRGAGAIDFNEYLRLAGLKLEVQWKKASRPDGTLIPDKRIGLTVRDGSYFLVVYPGGAWMRAGLRNGDQLLNVNGSTDNFSNLIHELHMGDHATVEVKRDGKSLQITVPMEPFDEPEAKIQELPNPSDRQKAILAQWSASQ